MTYCAECGKKLKETSKFCSSCGYELNSSHETPKRKTEDVEVEDEETFECEHCGKSFTNETICLRHEKNCYKKPHKERETMHWKWQNNPNQQKSNAGVIIFVIIIIVIAAIILMAMYGQQQHASSFAGQTESLIDKIFG